MGTLTVWALTQVAEGQPTEQCCKRKTVGGLVYSLVNEVDTSGYNCKTNCLYEKDAAPGSRYCFASGDLPVVCGDGNEGCYQICHVEYPSNWTGPTVTPDIESCPAECDICSPGGIQPPPNTVVYFHCYKFPPP